MFVLSAVGIGAAIAGFWSSFRLVRQAQRREGEARHAQPEFLQRGPARDGLGVVLGHFVEFVAHNFSFVVGFGCCSDRNSAVVHLSTGRLTTDATCSTHTCEVLGEKVCGNFENFP